MHGKSFQIGDHLIRVTTVMHIENGPKAERRLGTAVGETLIRWCLAEKLGADGSGASFHFRRFCFPVHLA